VKESVKNSHRFPTKLGGEFWWVFSLAYSAIEQGYVVVGKYAATTYYRADDPIAFYLCFAGMFVFGLIGIAGAIIPFFVPREKKESYMTYVDSNVFHVRKSNSLASVGLVLFRGIDCLCSTGRAMTLLLQIKSLLGPRGPTHPSTRTLRDKAAQRRLCQTLKL